MKRSAEAEVKNLIRRVRLVCDQLNDCPIKKARQPSQLDCLVCILTDMESMRAELKSLREFKAQATIYGTSITKLEASLDESLLPVLKDQMKKSHNA
jgi:hypothetical protein